MKNFHFELKAKEVLRMYRELHLLMFPSNRYTQKYFVLVNLKMNYLYSQLLFVQSKHHLRKVLILLIILLMLLLYQG